MPRVVPSQVVAFINRLWPSSGDLNNLQRTQAGYLSGLVDLVEQIPAELLVMDTAIYALFLSGTAHIRQKLLSWVSDQSRGHELGLMPGASPQSSPVTVIRDALATCRDEAPAPGTSELNFIADLELRANLRIDIGAITRALSNGEWKAATVLAGSAIEALLLWALRQRPSTDVDNAITAVRNAGILGSQPHNNLEKWNLHEYTEVAACLGAIKEDTRTEIDLAREFRNLIHPGRAQRLGQKCDRGTALASVAALEHVVRDLS